MAPYFHAAEDQHATRNEVFSAICRNLEGVRCDAIILNKPSLEADSRDPSHFYPQLLGRIIAHVLYQYDLNEFEQW